VDFELHGYKYSNEYTYQYPDVDLDQHFYADGHEHANQHMDINLHDHEYPNEYVHQYSDVDMDKYLDSHGYEHTD
jgi:hypothetical protein